jgi:hypothetical protein
MAALMGASCAPGKGYAMKTRIIPEDLLEKCVAASREYIEKN